MSQQKSSKLLGVQIDEDMNWNEHVYGKGGLISSLNQRTHMIRRLRNHIGGEKLRKIVDSLWTSKLRYGLQLWATVRMEETQPKKQAITDVQKVQNKLLRILEKKRISDKVEVKTMLKNQGMLSINQTAAQIKLVEMWKAKHVEIYPINVRFQTTVEGGRTTC